jgi:carbon storage regulator
MLILTRTVGESFSIGDDITIRVLDVARGEARLGIDAPMHVKIDRAEVVERIAARLDLMAKQQARSGRLPE